MAKVQVIKDNEGNKVYPITSDLAVLDGEGKSVRTKMSQIELNVGELIGNKATTLTDGKIEGGKVYTISLTEADDTLTIDSIEVSDYESVIYLSIGADVEEPVVLPDSYKSIGVPSFEAGKSYVIGVLNGIIIANEITEN